MAKVGIIGGSGLDDPSILENEQTLEIDTPYGKPSSALKTGKIANQDVILLARHGREHTVPPTQVNFRANIHALKQAGCTHLLATTAVGSLREEIKEAARSCQFGKTDFRPSLPVLADGIEPGGGGF